MATGTAPGTAPATPFHTLVAKIGPHAPKIMLAAAAAGLIAAVLPAVTITLSFLGTGTSETVAVWRDWRGKLDLLAYLGVGVMAVMTLRTPDTPAAKKPALACLIVSGVAVLLAVWLPLSVRGVVPKELGSLSVGVGCYLNVLASVALTAGAALQAKRADVF